MAEESGTPQPTAPAGEQSQVKAPVLHVAPSPHAFDSAQTTQKMMVDVLIALAPVVGASVYVFKLYAVQQILICMVSAVLAEGLLTWMRGKKPSLRDCSAAVTGLILALSLPGTAPWYVGFIGAFVAIGIGKVIFGGLGQNIFNPAMVGRAFVMLAFAGVVGASGYILKSEAPAKATTQTSQTSQAAQTSPGAAGGTEDGVRSSLIADLLESDAITKATPMTLGKALDNKLAAGEKLLPAEKTLPSVGAMFLGNVNGSLGETSALACLLGGLYLLLRRTASWQIPAGVLIAATAIGLPVQLWGHSQMTLAYHLLGGAMLFGAFFIATDLVTSPITPKGKFIFGLGVGALVMLFRLLSNYPEGMMFAVLIMNAMAPLINQWTIPMPLGGPVPAPAAKK